MSRPIVLHLIETVGLGGAMRAVVAIAKRIPLAFDSEHYVAPISLGRVEQPAVEVAQASGLKVLNPQSREQLLNLVAEADLVHLHWWNHPSTDSLLRAGLPPCRLIAWCHVGGHQPPQLTNPILSRLADRAVACSPYTYESAGFSSLSPEERIEKTCMIYGPADFDRVEGRTLKPHAGFNIGYIGTVQFMKMHPHFTAMSAAARIPDSKFIICGTGLATDIIRQQAQVLGCENRFDIRGFVEDVGGVLENLDIYGYPLCRDNYSGSELNLQEAMYLGLPVVVFPYGGVSRLVINDFTGLVVHSEFEYSRALEYLYHNPAERERLGDNARNYARQTFGAEIAARKFAVEYQRVLQMPKRPRQWVDELSTRSAPSTGAELFMQSIKGFELPFVRSQSATTTEDKLRADQQIGEMSELMRSGGVTLWQGVYPNDPWLALWRGIMELHAKNFVEAIKCFVMASNSGFSEWRIAWYIAQASFACGALEQARSALSVVSSFAPEFTPAQQLINELRNPAG